MSETTTSETERIYKILISETWISKTQLEITQPFETQLSTKTSKTQSTQLSKTHTGQVGCCATRKVYNVPPQPPGKEKLYLLLAHLLGYTKLFLEIITVL